MHLAESSTIRAEPASRHITLRRKTHKHFPLTPNNDNIAVIFNSRNDRARDWSYWWLELNVYFALCKNISITRKQRMERLLQRWRLTCVYHKPIFWHFYREMVGSFMCGRDEKVRDHTPGVLLPSSIARIIARQSSSYYPNLIFLKTNFQWFDASSRLYLCIILVKCNLTRVMILRSLWARGAEGV